MDISIINENRIKISMPDDYKNINSVSSQSIDIQDDNGYITIHKDGLLVIKELKVDPIDSNEYRITLRADYNAAFGMGERFDRVNQKNLSKTIAVEEVFTRQGEKSYCPIPFFFTDSGFGVFIDSYCVTKFNFLSSGITIDISREYIGKMPDIYVFLGTPKEMVSSFTLLTGRPVMPPKWAMGPWMSGHRWNTQALVEEQIEEMEQSGLPFNVLVIEAWSDESTFYIWNDAKYDVKPGQEMFKYSDFDFTGNKYWNNPKEMIEKLHEKGIRLILWQIPAMKNTDNKQHAEDRRYVQEEKLVAFNPDGSPYEIPKGYWFYGSMIPDFTNPTARKWWTDKRQYLLDIGVDGFKSDGGEFIHREDILFHDGKTGREMKNGYVQSYLRAYSDFVGKDRVLFTRAGYVRQQTVPMTWAGDQLSTWGEFRAILVAGLSAGLSGIPYWSFDIAGFAGPMPSVELYERATQTAVFTPGMQWHSEPIFGQFAEIMPSSGGRNDRSPWNMARAHNDPTLVERLKYHYYLRMNLLPYLYSEALKSEESCEPMMRHLFLEYPEDKNTLDIDDQFIMGDLLIAPIVRENCTGRSVYSPCGQWIDLWDMKEYEGGKAIFFETGAHRIPALIRKGGALALNLGNEFKLGSSVGNNVDQYKNLCFFITGDNGQYRFKDNLGNDIQITWINGQTKSKVMSGSTDFRIIKQL
ncbi:MAG: glycosyl hydrolase [Clostridia bacterium]|nr:glycosyl hydrolase [Clostridia bacterium]